LNAVDKLTKIHFCMSIGDNMNDSASTGGFIALLILFVFFAFGWSAWIAYGTQRTETFTVQKAERIQDKDSSKYLVYTDKGVYKDTDSFLLMKFNSSDLYAIMIPGQKFDCTVNGYRIPFLSQYPNLIDCKVSE